MTKTRPIILSTESVRGILSGKKTQMRRVMCPQPVLKNRIWEWHTGGWSNGCNPVFLPGHGMYNRMPYKPGDRLWVKETFQIYESGVGDGTGEQVVLYKATAKFRDKIIDMIIAEKDASSYEQAVAMTTLVGQFVGANTISKEHALALVAASSDTFLESNRKPNE